MRLIDADDLYDLIDGGFDIDFDETPETKRELLRMVKVSPTIDAEPVIRCKDCKWFGTHTGWKGNRFSVCRNVDGGMAYIKAYDYCSRAERKDG